MFAKQFTFSLGFAKKFSFFPRVRKEIFLFRKGSQRVANVRKQSLANVSEPQRIFVKWCEMAKKKRTLANHLNPRFQRLRTFANVCERLKLFAKNLRKCIFRNSQRNFEHVQNFFANVKTVCERLQTFATVCEPLRTLKNPQIRKRSQSFAADNKGKHYFSQAFVRKVSE